MSRNYWKKNYTLNNAEEIKRNLFGAYYLMQEGEAAAIIQLREAVSSY
jgi:DNA repair protein RecN (Recombination protein N)